MRNRSKMFKNSNNRPATSQDRQSICSQKFNLVQKNTTLKTESNTVI